MNWDQPQLFARNILRSPISQSPRSISPYRRNRFTAEFIGDFAVGVFERESAINCPADNYFQVSAADLKIYQEPLSMEHFLLNIGTTDISQNRPMA
jgi:hypothetical protein